MAQDRGPANAATAKQLLALSTLDAELAVFIQPVGWGIRTALVLRRAAAMPQELSIRLGLIHTAVGRRPLPAPKAIGPSSWIGF